MNANQAAARVLKRAIAAAYHDHVDYGHQPGQSVESSIRQGVLSKPRGDEDADSIGPVDSDQHRYDLQKCRITAQQTRGIIRLK